MSPSPSSPPQSPTTEASADVPTPGPRAKAGRRPHRKSRTGCKRCKERRVKCSEERPICFHCKRHGTPCVYPISDLARHSRDGASARTSQGYGGSPAYGNYPPGACFEMKDLALMHHWSMYACDGTFTQSQSWVRDLWQTVVPGIAFRHRYLMHGMLALAALHLAYLDPANSRELLIDAATHHNEAIRGFRDAMEDINEDNCNAIFATSNINVFYVFATMGRRNDDQGREDAKGFELLDMEWISVVRGCGAVLVPVHRFVEQGPLSGLLKIGEWDGIDPDEKPGNDDEQLRAIKAVWAGEQVDRNSVEAYDKTLYLLRRTMSYMDHYSFATTNGPWAGPFIWLHVIPDHYFELLWQRQPPALVIFAYFGALIKRLDHLWWGEGWSTKLVSEVDKALGSYWRPRIEWPLSVVGLQPAVK